MLVKLRKHSNDNKKPMPMATTASRKKNEGLIQTAFSKVEDKTPSLFHSSDHNVQAKDEVKPAEQIHYGYPGWKTKHPQVILGNIPAKSNCYRIISFKSKETGKSHASLAKDQKLKLYEKNFGLQCIKYRNAHINVDFELELDVYFPTKKSDLDNSLKVLFDCLQVAEAISNDNLCQGITARKHVDADNPRIEFTIHINEPLKEWIPKTKRGKKAVRPAKTMKGILQPSTEIPKPLF